MVFQQGMLSSLLQIVCDHFRNHFLQTDLRYPAEFFLGVARVTQEGFNFCRSKVTGINSDDLLPNL